MRNSFLIISAFVLSIFPAANCIAADFYAKSSVDKLTITEGKIATDQPSNSIDWQKSSAMKSRIVMDDGGEAFFAHDDAQPAWSSESQNLSQQVIAFHSAKSGPMSGTLYYAKPDLSGMEKARFTVDPADHSATEAEFLKAKLNYYDTLWHADIPGKMLFRQQAMAVRNALGKDAPKEADESNNQFVRESEMEETFDLFSGGQAVSENLQLDRALPSSTQPTVADVKVAGIKGISLRDFDWKPLIKDAHPTGDALASIIPADQHAFLFPSMQSCFDVAAQADRQAGTVISAMNSVAGDANVRQKYERQLGMPMTSLAKVLGPMLVKSVAITGSDLYLPEGTDLAILFEANDPNQLQQLLVARLAITAAAEPSAKKVSGTVAGVDYKGLVSDDRVVCSYIATVGSAVVVTNSLAQLEKIAGAKNGSPALSSLPEYSFFRTRYAVGDAGESAFLILSDATIRRWCSPFWRIAESRRIRAAAVLGDVQAKFLKSIYTGTVEVQKIKPEWSVPGLDELQLDNSGVSSKAYGRLGFLTPISEMKFDSVTKTESEFYDRWRTSYESNFKRMDPIAIRLKFTETKLSADITVMPLIGSSDYAQFVEVVGASKLAATSADLHDSLAQVAMAIDPKSKPMMSFAQTIQTFGAGVKIDPFGWVGHSISLYADDGPFWKEMADAKGHRRISSQPITRSCRLGFMWSRQAR